VRCSLVAAVWPASCGAAESKETAWGFRRWNLRSSHVGS
jgi:hypothetical protein